MNAILAIVLPDIYGNYDYFIEDNTCPNCHCRTLKTGQLFRILSENMFNIKSPDYVDCDHHSDSNPVYSGESSYILSVKWSEFINNPNRYINRSLEINSKRDDYNIVKKLKPEW